MSFNGNGAELAAKVSVEEPSDLAIMRLPRDKCTVSLVIPTMDEEDAIREVLTEAKAILDKMGWSYEVIIVDRSTDRTPDIARELGAKVYRQVGSGYGNAYIQGFARARGKVTVMVDADCTYELPDLPKMVKMVLADESVDMVVADRFANAKPGAFHPVNRFGNRMLSFFINALYRVGVSDTQSGFRAIRTRALRALYLRDPGMPFATEMLIEAREKGLSVVLVPSSYHPRKGEAKLVPWKDGARIMLFIVRLLKDYNPLALFGALSLVFLLPGLVFGLDILSMYFNGADLMERIAYVVLTVLLITTGLQQLSLGFVLDSVQRGRRFPGGMQQGAQFRS